MLRTLHENWTLRPIAGPFPHDLADAGPIPATVPGTVHTDLLSAGLIPDPYVDRNEHLLAWIGLTDWCYESTFDWTADGDEVHELVFEGLDTVATIELNGQQLGRTANMHRTYRFDVGDVLVPGPNRLCVTFASAVRYADRASLELGARPHVNHHPYNAIRKMACNFGWDWGPDLVTAGIWRSVSLRSWSKARIRSVRPIVDVAGANGVAEVHVEVARTGSTAAGLVVSAAIGDVTVSSVLGPDETMLTLALVVEDVRRWWPRGYGDPHLYDLSVSIGPESADGSDPATPLDTWHGQLGFRTVRLDTRPDDAGLGVAFVVNEQPVFVKGANWIPDDAFPHRVTRDRYQRRLAQAEEAGINLLRVWGGGIYEADDFYRECDQRGIMTWQDFLFSCAAYAEEEPLRSEVIAEARDNVVRLMPHPSLVMWNGCNENIWGYADWRWAEYLDSRTWGAGYYFDLLPSIVEELDPGRPYVAGSPWSWSPDQHPNDPAHGTMHIWDVWNQLDYTAYRGHRPRFVAEFGWQAPPTWATLRAAITDEPLTPESPGMLGHQKAADGNLKLTGGLLPHFPLPANMEDWHWAMSLNQARAIGLAIEYFRSLYPLCTGSIVWQLNDCWPSVSWSAIDGAGRRKPLHYALRHAHADRLVTVQPDGQALTVVVLNDTAEPWTGTVRISWRTFGGFSQARLEVPFDVAPRETAAIAVPPRAPDLAVADLLVAETDEGRGLWFFAEDRDSGLPAPVLRSTVDAVEGGYDVTVTAETLLRDLALLADKLDPDAVVDDMLHTLLPGETVMLHVATSRVLDPAALVQPNVLRCANQLVHPTAAPASSDLTSVPAQGGAPVTLDSTRS